MNQSIDVIQTEVLPLRTGDLRSFELQSLDISITVTAPVDAPAAGQAAGQGAGQAAAPAGDRKQAPRRALARRSSVASRVPAPAVAVAAFLAVSTPLYFAARAPGLGELELHHPTESPLFWIRTAVLFALGILLSRPKGQDFAISPLAIAVSIAYGTLAGFVLPLGLVRAPVWAAALVGFANALAEGAFFRLYLGRVLDRAIEKPPLQVIAMTLLHAAYQITLFEPSPGRIAYVVLGISLPAALIQEKTESAVAAWLCQTTISVAVLIASAY